MMSEVANHGSETLERPFPWRCPRCRKKSVHRTTIPYQCRRKKHQGETVIVTVPALAVPQCSECGELEFDYVAEAQINDAFRQIVNSAGAQPAKSAR